MSRFDNKLCPICRKPLNENSDIVVCPVCGTPHHRACYMMNNRCGVEEYHASGFEWQGRLPWEEPPITVQEEQAAQTGFNDPHQAEYPNYGGNQNGAEQGMNGAVNLEDFLNRLHDQTMDETRGADGVSSRELCTFVGRSVMHYSQAFAAFRAPTLPGQKKRFAFFNICAGLFAPIHQFYRRMDVVGIGLLLLELVYDVPAVLYTMGYITDSAFGMVRVLSSGLSFLVMIAMSVFGDYIYYRFSVNRIKKIRMKYDDGKAEGYYEALAEKGTPSWLRAIIAILAVNLVQAFVMLYAAQVM